uniref:Uncharacterized protein n=1 Tax=Anguilla anguilla TaxID=7936 RepID=A0A0E9U362_ANGAN
MRVYSTFRREFPMLLQVCGTRMWKIG